MYDEIIDDPKVLSLTPTDRWLYIATLAISNRQEVRGTLPMDQVRINSESASHQLRGKSASSPYQTLAIHLRLAAPKVAKLLERLVEAELLDRAGTWYVIHGWSKRQRKSDNVAERVATWRENHPVTLQKRDRNVPRACATDTDTDTDTDSPLPPEGDEGGDLEPFQADPGRVSPPKLPEDKQKCYARQVQRFGANGGDAVILDLLEDYSAVIVSAACDHHYLETKGRLQPKQLAGICRAMHNGTWKIPEKNGRPPPGKSREDSLPTLTMDPQSPFANRERGF